MRICLKLNQIAIKKKLQYLPIEGLAAFNKATAELLFGAGHPVIKEQKVCLESCVHVSSCLDVHFYELCFTNHKLLSLS